MLTPRTPLAALLVLAAAPLCRAHFTMMTPFSWHDTKGQESFYAGCTGKHAPGQIEASQGCAMEWYTNHTFIPGAATIKPNSPLLTYQSACGNGASACCDSSGKPYEPLPGGCDWTAKNPWRAPGTAPIFSPCGIDGGNPQGCPAGNPDGSGCAGGGYGHGPDGRSLLNTQALSTNWTLGQEAEVKFAIVANHGGGYSYRLCKRPSSEADLTEECFQGGALRFAGSTQTIVSRANGKVVVELPAVRTDQGTTPTGSEWSRNPIPACGSFAGGSDRKCDGSQFPPPAPGVLGFSMLPYDIVDRVQVPSSLPPGDYVISLRFDSEQTPQVWNTCGHVHLLAPAADSCALHPACLALGIEGTCCPTKKGLLLDCCDSPASAV